MDKILRENRDRRGGHQCSMIAGEGGFVFNTPKQRNVVKRKQNRKRRREHNKIVAEAMREYTQDIQDSINFINELDDYFEGDYEGFEECLDPHDAYEDEFNYHYEDDYDSYYDPYDEYHERYGDDYSQIYTDNPSPLYSEKSLNDALDRLSKCIDIEDIFTMANALSFEKQDEFTAAMIDVGTEWLHSPHNPLNKE